MTETPIALSIQPTRYIRAKSYDFGYDHEVQIALPASYATSDQAYPVLWVMDGAVFFDLAASTANLLAMARQHPEFIVVGVGHSSSAEVMNARRLIDFFPMDDLSLDSLGNVAMWGMVKGGHASDFLSFLVDELRPLLASEFRMLPDQHAIAGVSGGGYFSTYSLLTRPDAFAAYLIASPPYELGHGEIFDLETEYAANNSDLPAKVYFVGGVEEIFEPGIGDIGIIASMVRMAANFKLRGYPSLELSCDLLGGVSHLTVGLDLFKNGIQRVWGKAVDPAFNQVDQLAQIAKVDVRG